MCEKLWLELKRNSSVGSALIIGISGTLFFLVFKPVPDQKIAGSGSKMMYCE